MIKLVSVLSSLAFVGIIALSGTGATQSGRAVEMASANPGSMSADSECVSPTPTLTGDGSEVRSCALGEADLTLDAPRVCGPACTRQGGFCCGGFCC